MKAREKLIKRIAEYSAVELHAAALEVKGRKVVRRIFAAEDAEEAKAVAHALARQPATVALMGVQGKPAMLIFAQTAGGASDMGSILKQTVAKVAARAAGRATSRRAEESMRRAWKRR